MSNIDNPYLNNRNDWNELLGREKANAAMWRMFSLLLIGVTIFAIGGMIYAAKLPRVVPFLFKEDGSGGITALGIPNTQFRVDNRLLANQLAIFIRGLREVPEALEMRRNNIHVVRSMASEQLFTRQLSAMMKSEYTDIGGNEQSIIIKSILPISQETWEVDWIENKDGVQMGRYKASINFKRLPIPLNSNSNQLILNPLGLSIMDISINPVIGG